VDILLIVNIVFIIVFMLILAHIIISVLSLAVATSTLLRPSALKMGTSYSLIVLSIVSGSLLATGQDINIVHVCSVGIAYTVIVTYMTVMGGRKLASLELDD
jgi:hypothetical protein